MADQVVTVDADNWIGATIDTDKWLEAIFGEPDAALTAAFAAYQDETDNRWELEDIADFCDALGLEYHAQNTYNHENDLSHDLDWGYVTDRDAGDIYDARLVILRRHHGGDVRGNYGPVEIYRVNDVDSELFYFTQPYVGWYASAGTDADGNAIPTNDLYKHTEQFETGYSANPSYQLGKACGENFERIDDETLKVTLDNGVQLTLHPQAPGVY